MVIKWLFFRDSAALCRALSSQNKDKKVNCLFGVKSLHQGAANTKFLVCFKFSFYKVRDQFNLNESRSQNIPIMLLTQVKCNCIKLFNFTSEIFSDA